MIGKHPRNPGPSRPATPARARKAVVATALAIAGTWAAANAQGLPQVPARIIAADAPAGAAVLASLGQAALGQAALGQASPGASPSALQSAAPGIAPGATSIAPHKVPRKAVRKAPRLAVHKPLARGAGLTPVPADAKPTAPTGPVSPYVRPGAERAQAGEPPPGHAPLRKQPGPASAPAAQSASQ